MSRIAGYLLTIGIIIGVVVLVIVTPPHEPDPTCGFQKLATALSSDEVAWSEFGWDPAAIEVSQVRGRDYKYIPEGGCEVGFIHRPGGLGTPCTRCIVVLAEVVTAPTEPLLADVVMNYSSSESFYQVTQVAEQHWEEVIPEKFRATSGSIFSWTASGCRVVLVRWDLDTLGYEDREDRANRAAAFLESLDGDGCTPQPSSDQDRP